MEQLPRDGVRVVSLTATMFFLPVADRQQVTFFVCAKKVTKESAPPSLRPQKQRVPSHRQSSQRVRIRYIPIPDAHARDPSRAPSGLVFAFLRCSA